MSTPPASAIPRRGFLARVAAVLAGGVVLPRPARAASAPEFLGEIRLFAGTFAPAGWALCNGQILPIASYTALYSILGNTYGGDGHTTFALPDLRGRVPIHAGQGTGLTPRTLGAQGGAATRTLAAGEMPLHTHTVRANASPGTDVTPAPTRYLARNAAGIPQWGDSPSASMSGVVSTSGGGGSHTNVQPYLVLHYIIALQGVVPAP